MSVMERVRNAPVVKELTPRTFAVFMFMSIGALNFGFDNGWWSSVLTVQEFADYYGPPSTTGESRAIPSSWQSAGSGTANAGMVIGCLIAGAVGRKIGRRWSIVLLVVIALMGMVIQNVIHSFWAVMAGRMVNAISMGIEANTIPVFMAELSPPAIRGTIVNFYQFWQLCGVLLASGVVIASRKYENQWAFRTVMVVQCFITLILLFIVWFLPESPRWLLLKNRREDARAALAFIRKGAASAEDVEKELQLLEEANAEQAEFHKATTYLDCVKGSNGRRTMIAASVQVLQQLQGNSFVSSYGVIFLKQLGVKDALEGHLSMVAMAVAGALFAFYLSDRIGRRTLLLVAAVACWAFMWLASGLSSFWPGGVSGDAAKGSLASMLIWYFFSTMGWRSCVWITTSEVATSQLRERTISIATSLSFVAVLLVSYINPFVQNEPGNLQSRVGFVYGSFSLISVFWVYFFMPELSGRSLEELDELFQAKVPARKFGKYRAAGVGAKITAIQDTNADAHIRVIEGTEINVEESVKFDQKV
ncbi:hypothetical protein M409DRAFT_22799 [Zasmidium cellare ATCC 36951]|uniref:Major facilitator superfamily (MFS) profile domain-containing protein n=1 Tax=Zasmidium cellare ATCC 36951 TaxID=1080233 RepID=A0A6A6CHY5_ZASCE|nr:uncharacterized protein M409DRAFT_22799 [Zasmidium cellare ATCC 36951]KAF2166745.1 hypothetical protein M409DRAFT_22799 [Zasmidium cellare ATCC 36951]